MTARSEGPPEEPNLQERGRLDPFVLGAFAVVVLFIWLRPLTASLWVDELGTYWVIKDGLGDAISRAARYQGQSPLFYAIAWAMKQVGGNREWVLRIPSLIAMLGTAWILYRLALRTLGDARSAGAALVFFAALEPIGFAAADARPYAIGLLAFTAATLLLVRWIDGGRSGDLVGYLFTSALAIYIHYLLGIAVFAHFVFLYTRRAQLQGRARALMFGAVGFAVLLIPALPQVLSLFERREALSTSGAVPIPTLLDVLVPGMLFGGVVLGWAIAYAFIAPPAWRLPAGARAHLPLIALIVIVPPVVLFLATLTTSARMFSDRYYIAAFTGLALAAAAIVGGARSAPFRRCVIATVAFLAVLAYSSPFHTAEDWRGAAQRVRALDLPADAPILMHAAFIESLQPDWYTDPERSSYLNAPAAAYPMGGEVIPMPFAFDDEAVAYLETLIDTRLSRVERFVYITRRAYVPTHVWLEARLKADGFTVEALSGGGGVVPYVFTRDA